MTKLPHPIPYQGSKRSLAPMIGPYIPRGVETFFEPFAGSGTTVEACIVEGFQCIAIEREADYLVRMLAIVEGTTVKYCTPDHLGTPRIVTGQSGATATLISRHDYFPYGEEILDGSSGRIGIAGYSQADNVNQRFTSYERDAETGLDFARARYFGSGAGRFSSIDPKMTSARCANPQTFNRYSYCANNPVVLVDPSGKDWYQNDKTHIYYYLQGSGARAPRCRSISR